MVPQGSSTSGGYWNLGLREVFKDRLFWRVQETQLLLTLPQRRSIGWTASWKLFQWYFFDFLYYFQMLENTYSENYSCPEIVIYVIIAERQWMTKTIWGVCEGVKRRNILRQHKITQQVKRADLQMVAGETECPSQPPFSSYLHKIVNAIGERVLGLYFSAPSVNL